MIDATVREWHDDLGWGAVHRPEAPGGCWALIPDEPGSTRGVRSGEGPERASRLTLDWGDDPGQPRSSS